MEEANYLLSYVNWLRSEWQSAFWGGDIVLSDGKYWTMLELNGFLWRTVSIFFLSGNYLIISHELMLFEICHSGFHKALKACSNEMLIVLILKIEMSSVSKSHCLHKSNYKHLQSHFFQSHWIILLKQIELVRLDVFSIKWLIFVFLWHNN